MKLFKNILDLIFIPKCGACFKALPSGEQALCEACLLKYESEKSAKCGRCGYPRRYCACVIKAEGKDAPLVHVTGYSTRRESVSKKMILRLKDNALHSLLDVISFDMAESFRFRCSIERSEDRVSDESTVFDCVSENTVITWIPRRKNARIKAGHDQSFELAKRVSQELDIPILHMFINVGKKAQKKLDPEKRIINAEKSYIIFAPKEQISGKNIIIIDDIVTTGASIKACINQLRELGAEKVIALTFAQTEAYREVYNDSPAVR